MKQLPSEKDYEYVRDSQEQSCVAIKQETYNKAGALPPPFCLLFCKFAIPGYESSIAAMRNEPLLRVNLILWCLTSVPS